MSGRNVIPTAQRAALLKMERTSEPVILHLSVANTLRDRGLVEAASPLKWRLTERGQALVKAMNDPTLTIEQVAAMYR